MGTLLTLPSQDWCERGIICDRLWKGLAHAAVVILTMTVSVGNVASTPYVLVEGLGVLLQPLEIKRPGKDFSLSPRRETCF